MLQIISYEMRKTAEFIIFAESLSLEELSYISEGLVELLKDEDNFDLKAKIPLTFSKKGLKAINDIDSTIATPHLMGTIKRLDALIKASPAKDLRVINNSLDRVLRRLSGKWINLVPKGKDFAEIKKDVINNAILPFTTVLDGVSSVSKRYDPKKYKYLTDPYAELSKQLK